MVIMVYNVMPRVNVWTHISALLFLTILIINPYTLRNTRNTLKILRERNHESLVRDYVPSNNTNC